MPDGRARSLVLALGLVTLAVALLFYFSRTKQRPLDAAPMGSATPLEATPKKPSDNRTDRLKVLDVHVHLNPGGFDRLQGLMTQYGFDHVVNLSGGHPLQGLRQQLAIAQQNPGMVTVFASLAYEQAQKPDYGQRMAQLLEYSHRLGAKGLKIAKYLGLGLVGPNGQRIPVDDPELDVLFETAGALGMPVAIHSGDPKAFWLPITPENERFDELKAHPGWAVYGKDVPSFDGILQELERRIARHPNTRFISVHFGNAAEEPDRVARMLREYPNLYIDTAARIPEMGRHSPEKMRAFFEEFQDRILYGSDLGVGPVGTSLFLGSQGAEPPTDAEEQLFFSASKRYFETRDEDFAHPTPIQGNWTINGIGLSRAILKKVYYENAAQLLGLSNASAKP